MLTFNEYTELNKNGIEPDSNEDDNSFEFRVTRIKKDKTVTMAQLFDEAIKEYNYENQDKTEHNYFEPENDDNDAEIKGKKVTETICKVNMAAADYLNVTDSEGEHFILLPRRNGTDFKTGTWYHLFTERFKDHSFVLAYWSNEEYENCKHLIKDMDVTEACIQIKKANEDPEGFALWGKLGKVKRSGKVSRESEKKRLITRAEEMLARIPIERNDLYYPLEETYKRYVYSPGNERADREKDLKTKMSLVAMMLTSKRAESYLTAERIAACLEKAKVTSRNVAGHNSKDWIPNVLIAGFEYKTAVEELFDSQIEPLWFEMGAINSNEYLFGDPMSYCGTRLGELADRITLKGEIPHAMLFSDVDIIGNNFRSGDPVNGLARLFRNHSFTDAYLANLTIVLENTQLICHTSSIEECPALILKEMDIIVEL